MKKLIAFASLTATPVLAHPGHAELPGAGGHDLVHGMIAVGMGAAVWLAFKLWQTSRKEE